MKKPSVSRLNGSRYTFNLLSILDGPLPEFLGLVDDFISMPVDLSKNGGLHTYTNLDDNTNKVAQITFFVSGYGSQFPRSEIEVMS